jgi:thiamine-phosphate pyrophosphorylase
MNAQLSIGLSTTNETQMSAGINEGADYLAIGPVFGTKNKTNPHPTLGVSRLRDIATHARSLGFSGPLVAIGGLDIDNVRIVGEIVDAVAIIGGLLPSSSLSSALREVEQRAKDLHAAILSVEKKVLP